MCHTWARRLSGHALQFKDAVKWALTHPRSFPSIEGVRNLTLRQLLRLQRQTVVPANPLLVRSHRVHHELIVDTIVGRSASGGKMACQATYTAWKLAIGPSASMTRLRVCNAMLVPSREQLPTSRIR